LKFTNIPANYYITEKDKTDDKRDSDVDISTGKSIITELTSGEVDRSWDMGIVEFAKIGDKVWEDSNANGVQDSTEEGVTDINVTLFKNCDTTPSKIGSTTTDANGDYLFVNLEPNSYCLEFTELPIGANITPKDRGDDNNDSDVDPATGKTIATDIVSGEDNRSWDMGIYYLASLGDRVWYDTNKNGIQDDGEEGVEDINVTLYANDCSTSLEESVTDENGTYLFSNLMPSEYCLGFSNLPSGYEITTQDSGADTLDSDVNSTLKISAIHLSSNENNMSFDMGIHPKAVTPPPSATPTPRPIVPPSVEPTPAPETSKACFGDRVWEDTNRDGIQDRDENGVANITVILYQSDCTTEINRTKTDTSGHYLFSELDDSEYCVGFTGLPTDYKVTVKDRGDNDTKDSDVNPESKKTDSFTLVAGEQCDISIDMGIYKETPIQELRVYDDLVTANTEGAVTTIHLLDNDAVGERSTISFVDMQEGETLWNNGSAVAGSTLNTTDTLYVAGEGTWRVEDDGTVTFTADDGFDGTPSAIYYMVRDEEGNQSNVAQLSIVTDCVCDPYIEKSSVATLERGGILVLMLLSSLLSLTLFRRELEE
jgi:hypothetical protein